MFAHSIFLFVFEEISELGCFFDCFFDYGGFRAEKASERI
jgi:hypothetical protein